MRVKLTAKGIEILQPKKSEPMIPDAKRVNDKLEERKRKSIDVDKIKTTKKRRMYAKDYPNEQTYMKAISKALFSYMKWAKEKGKL